MRTRHVVIVVLLVGGAALFVRSLLRPSTPGRSEGGQEAQSHPRHQAAAPALVGRSRIPGESGDNVPVAVSPADSSHSDEPSNTADSTEWGDAMHALLADIRLDVAPEWWGGQPDLGTLEGRNGVVRARAPPDVLDAITRYLGARRRGDANGVEEPPQLDVRAVDEVRVALRPVLLGILGRERKIGLAIEAWAKGRVAQAQEMAEEVLAEEDDNVFAEAIRRGVATSASNHNTSVPTVEELDLTRRRFQDLRKQQTLHAWVMRWPSVGTWKRLQSILEAAGFPEFRRLAPDLDELLDRGSVTVDLVAASLQEAVRQIQIRTFADVRIPEALAAEAVALRVAVLREESRSLQMILDELVRRLPEGWYWYAARRHVVMARVDQDGISALNVHTRLFDVKDILVPGSVPVVAPTPPSPSSPPPVYTPGRDGEPQVRVR